VTPVLSDVAQSREVIVKFEIANGRVAIAVVESSPAVFDEAATPRASGSTSRARKTVWP
jgi:hypothetical protein